MALLSTFSFICSFAGLYAGMKFPLISFLLLWQTTLNSVSSAPYSWQSVLPHEPDNYVSLSNFISFPLVMSSLGFFSIHDRPSTLFIYCVFFLFQYYFFLFCHSRVQWCLSNQQCKTYFYEVSNKTAMASCSVQCQEHNIKQIAL